MVLILTILTSCQILQSFSLAQFVLKEKGGLNGFDYSCSLKYVLMNFRTAARESYLGETQSDRMWIIGRHKLQNEVTARFLTESTTTQCSLVENLRDISCSDGGGNNQSHLLLVDYQGIDLQSFLAGFRSWTKSKRISQFYLVFFNVPGESGVEHALVRKGARGVFRDDDSLANFIKGVKALLRGELWLSREALRKCILEGKRSLEFFDVANNTLTSREAEILSLVATGSSNKEISEKLRISQNTVKTHLYNVFKKISVSNRLQAVLWAAKNLPAHSGSLKQLES